MRNDLTSDQHYEVLNDRFDKRAKQLIREGWKYERLEEYDIALFTRPKSNKGKKSIAASFLMTADDRTFRRAVKDRC